MPMPRRQKPKGRQILDERLCVSCPFFEIEQTSDKTHSVLCTGGCDRISSDTRSRYLSVANIAHGEASLTDF